MRRSKILNVKHKDQLFIKLMYEYEMMIYLIESKTNTLRNKELKESCSGRIKSLKYCIGFEDLDKEEKE